ncbi:uncharacterized protein [Solanum tuberosum]|uniref:uncharacterized protein n=1 Tax=Solanum tuberosum TaxID=4113 RepID=UPI0003D296FE|nr:PREDICTED: uncharacterized protein LOC102596719 [Solanum tuberosum]
MVDAAAINSVTGPLPGTTGAHTGVDAHHPLHLQACDTPGSSLVSIQLTGSENYSLWSRSMKIGLLGKGKLGFITGQYSKDKFAVSLHDLWEKCNTIVLSWIMISVSRELLSGIVYASSAQQVWTDLKERFDKVDGSRIFYLHKEIATLSQGMLSVSSYFSKLKELWMEFDSLMPCPSCACEVSKTYAAHFEYQMLMQFLLGLNESYNQCRSQIMMQDPAPCVNKAYSLVMAEESQRILGKSNAVSADNHGLVNDAMAFFSNNKSHVPRSGSSSYSGPNHPSGSGSRSHQRSTSNLYCDYCNWKGHIRATCYKLHGYPPDWKGKKRTPLGSIPAANLVGANAGITQLRQYSTHTGQGSTQSALGMSHSGSFSPTTSHALMSNRQSPLAHFDPQVQQHPHFSPQQYQQLLHMLDQENEKAKANTNCDNLMASGPLKWDCEGDWQTGE